LTITSTFYGVFIFVSVNKNISNGWPQSATALVFWRPYANHIWRPLTTANIDQRRSLLWPRNGRFRWH